MLETGNLEATGDFRMELTFIASFPENCDCLTCLVVPCKTILAGLSLFDMTQSGADLVGKAFSLRGLLKQLVSTV